MKRFRAPARAARLYDRAVGRHVAIKSVGQDLLDRRLDRLGKADVFEGERDAAQSVPIYGVNRWRQNSTVIGHVTTSLGSPCSKLSHKNWIAILGTLEARDGVNQRTLGDIQTLERRFSLQKVRPYLLSHTHWSRVQQPPHPQSA